MLRAIRSLWRDPEIEARVHRLEIGFNRHGYDRFGASRRDLTRFLSLLSWLYRHYFRVHVHDIHHVPARGRAMLVGNHSGGVALDGAMVLASVFLELEPPRLAQGMAEYFLARWPFLADWTVKCGQLTGLPEHAVQLLEDERLLLVFPEGARGTAKLAWQQHTLVRFGTGFVRLALQTRAPIVPFAFLGGGDAIPTIVNLERLGRALGAPYIPLTPYVVPLPLPKVRLDIVYGEPMTFDGDGSEEDRVIEQYVDRVKQRIAELLAAGEEKRR